MIGLMTVPMIAAVALAMLAAFAFFWRAMSAPETEDAAPAAVDTLP